MSVDMSTVDEAKLNELLGKVVTDLGAVAAAPLALLGERLGLFRALADGEAVTPGGLAERTGPPSATSANGWPRWPPAGT
ncbi:hypothetical protein [Streptomyces sp. NPDC003435]